MNQGKAQIYGTQTIGTKNRKTYVVPLQNVNRVDKLRQEVGLEPLAEYMKEFGKIWSKKIYLNELPQCKEAFGNWYKTRRQYIPQPLQ